MGDLSRNFSGDEFKCPCCGRMQVHSDLITGLQCLRDKAGAPLYILSGYRCERHNTRVGGSPRSQHLLGKAADIRIEWYSSRDTYDLASRQPEFDNGGIGLYPDQGFVHVDVRVNGPARWGYKDGKFVAIEQVL